jgi:hypothetical protein
MGGVDPREEAQQAAEEAKNAADRLARAADRLRVSASDPPPPGPLFSATHPLTGAGGRER